MRLLRLVAFLTAAIVGWPVLYLAGGGPLLAGALPAPRATSTSHGLPSPTVYVTDDFSGGVTPIDSASNSPGPVIQNTGGGPFGIAVTPDGRTAYVTDYGTNRSPSSAAVGNTVTPINLATGVAGAPITVGFGPWAIAITPDGRTAYVANNTDNTVSPIDLATGRAGWPIPVPSGPAGIAITPDGRTAYVTDADKNLVTPIDLATEAVGASIPVGAFPLAIAITPDGRTAYVANADGNTVTPIDLATNTPGSPIAVGTTPMDIAITPDGSTAYVTDRNASIDAGSSSTPGTVTPINLATNTPGSPITVGPGPWGIAITPDGSTAYVADGFSCGVTPIDLGSGVAGSSIATGCGPAGVAVASSPVVSIRSTPDGAGYWLASAAGAVANQGDAQPFGDASSITLGGAVVGMASTPSGGGYWLVDGFGDLYTFGGAGYFGGPSQLDPSAPPGGSNAVNLAKPIVGMAATPDGRGYWEVASDGGVFTFGDAGFFGSAGALPLAKPIVGMAATPDGGGYWLVASDGGIFTYGDALFEGSLGQVNPTVSPGGSNAMQVLAPTVGMAATPSGKGYLVVDSSGDVYTYGDALYWGSMGQVNPSSPPGGSNAVTLVSPIVAVAFTPDGGGYWLADRAGEVWAFGDAANVGSGG